MPELLRKSLPWLFWVVAAVFAFWPVLAPSMRREQDLSEEERALLKRDRERRRAEKIRKERLDTPHRKKV